MASQNKAPGGLAHPTGENPDAPLWGLLGCGLCALVAAIVLGFAVYGWLVAVGAL